MSEELIKQLKEIEQYSTCGDPLTDIAVIKGMATKIRKSLKFDEKQIKDKPREDNSFSCHFAD